MSALQLTRYLSNHFTYWSGEAGAIRYPRAMLRIVLNQALRHCGIRFPNPPEPEAADADGMPSAAPSALPAEWPGATQ